MTTLSPDAADIDALESLVVSDGWTEVARIVKLAIELKRDEMERHEGSEARAIPYMQGFVAACRMLLRLPEQQIAEIQRQMKENR